MPTYEYACRDCGEHLEVVQSFKDDALTTCPSCAGSLRKVFSAAGIIFKGSGWHVKDYAASNRSSGASSDASDSAKEPDGSKDSGGTKDGGSSTGSDSSKGSGTSTSSDAASGSGGKKDTTGSSASSSSSSDQKKSA